MENKPEFTSNLWGYKKEEVLQYIEQMTDQARQSEQQLQEKMEQITRSRQELEEQISSFEEKLQTASVDLDAERGKNKKLSEMIGLLQEEIDRQRRWEERREKDFQTLQENNLEMQEKMRTATEKSKQLDQAAATIGAAILEAQNTAEKIIHDANHKAEKISQNAGDFVAGILEKIEGMQQDFVSMRDRMNQSVQLLNERYDQIEQDILAAREMVLRELNLPQPPKQPKQEPQSAPVPPTPSVGKLSLTEEELQKHRYF